MSDGPVFRDPDGRDVFALDAVSGVLRLGGDVPGTLLLRDARGGDAVRIDARVAALLLGAAENGGRLVVMDGAGKVVFTFDAATGTLVLGSYASGGRVVARDDSGRAAALVDGRQAAVHVGAPGHAGELVVRDASAQTAVRLGGGEALVRAGVLGHAGRVLVQDADGLDAVRLLGDGARVVVGDEGVAGTVRVLDVAGDLSVGLWDGAVWGRGVDDLADGTVVVIGDDAALRPCSVDHDRRVAGVVFGARLALAGRVPCLVDGPVAPGDLLTTSARVGHATRAEPGRAAGAVLGKAMRSSAGGQAIVPVLIALQ